MPPAVAVAPRAVAPDTTPPARPAGDVAVMPGRVRMQRDDRRAAVLDAATAIIGEQGFRGFSINELARRCGLTTAGLLHHFGSKDRLLVALLEERDFRDAEVIRDVLGRSDLEAITVDETLAILRAIVARNAGQPQLVRLNALLCVEALTRDHPAQAYFSRKTSEATSLFAEILGPHVADPAATARQAVALMSGLEVQWLREDCGFDLVAEWDKAVAKLLR